MSQNDNSKRVNYKVRELQNKRLGFASVLVLVLVLVLLVLEVKVVVLLLV